MFILLQTIYMDILSYAITTIAIVINVLGHILNFVSSGMNESISISLITIQSGLIVVYFTFLPMILDNKSKEYYLGYKKSDWLIYQNNKGKENSIIRSWKTDVICIILEIFCVQFKLYFIVLIAFIIFMFRITKKVRLYTNFISNPNVYDEEIKEYFLENVHKDRSKIAENIQKHDMSEKSQFLQTLNFLLDNLENEDVKYVFEEIYGDTIESGNQKNIYTIYEVISQKAREKVINFCVIGHDWYNFIKSSINEANENSIYKIFVFIYENNLKLYDDSKRNYTLFLNNTIMAIEDSRLSDSTRQRWFKRIMQRIDIKVRMSKTKRGNVALFVYRDTVEFLKYIIDSKNEIKLNALYDFIKSMNSFKTEALAVIIGIYVYLIYLTQYEIDSYIAKEEKEYYLEVLKNLTNLMNMKDIKIYNSVKTSGIIWIFSALNNSYKNWERMKLWVVKSVKSETAYDLLLKLFVIYSKVKYFNILESIEEEELEIFKFKLIDGKMEENLENELLRIAKILKIPVSKENIDEYTSNIISFATNKYKNSMLVKKEIDGNLLQEKQELERIVNKYLKNAEFLNAGEFTQNCRVKIEYNQIIKNDDIISNYISWWKNEPEVIETILESRLFNILCTKIPNKVLYSYAGKEILLELEKYKDKGFIYVTSKNDYLGEMYNLGENYTDILKQYKIVHSSVKQARMIVNKLNIKFDNVKIIFKELSDEEVLSRVNDYKSNNKYIVSNNNIGYPIILTEKEIEDFCKNNFIKVNFKFYVYFGDYSNTDGSLLLEKN